MKLKFVTFSWSAFIQSLYEHEAVLKPKTENNIGVHLVPQ